MLACGCMEVGYYTRKYIIAASKKNFQKEA